MTVHLNDLPIMHPNLLWDEIAIAAVAVFTRRRRKTSFTFELSILEVPGCPEELLEMSIEAGRVSVSEVNRIRRTLEPARLVELAAIAIAGLGLYHAGEHRILDIAARASGADYLVDQEGYLLEVAGRSRRDDFAPAWQQKWLRLAERNEGGFYVCVAEFESFTGRLAFQD